jgi:hypothetical protein
MKDQIKWTHTMHKLAIYTFIMSYIFLFRKISRMHVILMYFFT